MSDQKLIVTKMLKDLNAADITTAQVERDLGIKSATFLNKVKRGIRNLGADKLEELTKYHMEKVGIKQPAIKPDKIISAPEVKSIPKKSQPPVINIKENKVMPKGLSLADQIEWRYKNA